MFKFRKSHKLASAEPSAPDAPEFHIGLELRARRIAMAASPEQIASALKIQPSYVHAIEQLDESALPAIGYTLGYVRAYAGHVGLNGKEAVARYKLDTATPEDLGRRALPAFVPKREIRLPKGLVPALTVVGCAGVLALWYAGSAPVEAVPSALTDILDESDYAPATLPDDPTILTLKATAPSWVQVSDPTGRTVMSRIMVTGETWSTSAENNYRLAARDGAAIELYSGTERLGVFGEKGVAFSGKAIAPATLIPALEDIPLTPISTD